MFCPTCGAEAPDGTKYCPVCGNDMLAFVDPPAKELQTENTPTANTPAAGIGRNSGIRPRTPERPPVSYAPEPDGFPEERPAGTHRWLLPALLCAVAALVVVMILFVVNGSVRIPLNDYVQISCSGYDGYGTASVQIDTSRLTADYGNRIKFNGNNSGSNPASSFAGLLSGHLDRSDGLANGDTVTWQWDVSAIELSRNFRVDPEMSNVSYTIEGLSAVQYFDPFENASVTFKGVSGEGTISDLVLPYASYLYSVDRESALSNGDIVTVSFCSEITDAELLDNYGQLPSPAEQTFTVTGLAVPVQTFDSIDPDYLDQEEGNMYAEMLEDYPVYFNNMLEIDSLDYLGYFFEFPLDSSDAHRNKLYQVYHLSLHMDEPGGAKGVTEIYYYLSFENIYIDENGSVLEGEYAPDIRQPDNTVLYSTNDSRYEYTITGFESLPDLFNWILEHDEKDYFLTEYTVPL